MCCLVAREFFWLLLGGWVAVYLPMDGDELMVVWLGGFAGKAMIRKNAVQVRRGSKWL